MPIAKRRSVSVDKFVDDLVDSFRSVALMNKNEMGYTTTLNLFAEFGIKCSRLLGKYKELEEMFSEVLGKYSAYDELKEQALLDEWKDWQEYKEWKKNRAEKS